MQCHRDDSLGVVMEEPEEEDTVRDIKDAIEPTEIDEEADGHFIEVEIVYDEVE